MPILQNNRIGMVNMRCAVTRLSCLWQAAVVSVSIWESKPGHAFNSRTSLYFKQDYRRRMRSPGSRIMAAYSEQMFKNE